MSAPDVDMPRPPRLASWIAGVRVPADQREFMLGDLDEEFIEVVVPARGLRGARRWYWRQALRSFVTRHGSAATTGAGARRSGASSPPMGILLQDLRFGARLLRRTPMFTAVVTLTVALGIGATTAIFSVVHAVLLQPPPFTDPDRLVVIREGTGPTQGNPASWPEFTDWRERATAFAGMAGYFTWDATLTGGSQPEQIFGMRASAALLPLLGVQPILGRTFTPAEETRSDTPVVLISEGLWRRRYGGDPGILGQTIVLNDVPFTVIGVTPAWLRSVRPGEAAGGQPRDLWAPLRLTTDLAPRSLHFLQVLARLKPDHTVAQSQLQLNAAMDILRQQNPESTHRVQITPVRQALVADSREMLLTMLGAVGFVLLIMCANLANLLLARASMRRQEIGIRMALGAGRARVVRQLLTESLMLATLGGAIGVLVAWVAVRMVAGSDVIAQAGGYGLALNWPVLAFALTVSLATGILFGLAPALQAGRQAATAGLGDRSRSMTGHARLRSALVVAELALTLMLLVGAGLLTRSFANLLLAPRGFDASHLLSFELVTPASKYPTGVEETRFFQTVVERLTAMPGVDRVGLVNALPLAGNAVNGSTPVEGQTYRHGEQPNAEKRIVSPGYFAALGIRVIKGRSFTDRDDGSAPAVALVSDAYARRYLAGDDPLTKRIGFNWDMTGFQQIIGVVDDVKQYGLDDAPTPMVYVSYLQRPSDAFNVVLKSSVGADALAAAARETIRSIDPNRPLAAVRTMDAVVSRSVATWRLAMSLASGFSLLAIVLAATGIFGVMSYVTRQRSREFGIRLALGATAGDVLRLALRTAVGLAAAGVIAGLAGASLVTRILASRLFGVTPTDPLTFVSVSLGLAAIALASSYVPVRRALRIDPASVLRAD